MGVCQECLVRIDGALRQACLVEAKDGMRVELGLAR
jgi:predicted molibdopterin-dependent oxidoreductase YjgC